MASLCTSRADSLVTANFGDAVSQIAKPSRPPGSVGKLFAVGRATTAKTPAVSKRLTGPRRFAAPSQDVDAPWYESRSELEAGEARRRARPGRGRSHVR